MTINTKINWQNELKMDFDIIKKGLHSPTSVNPLMNVISQKLHHGQCYETTHQKQLIKSYNIP